MHGDMALIEMADDSVRHRLNRPFRNQYRYTGTLRFIILLGNVEDIRPDDVGDLGQYSRQSLGTVLLINILDIFLAMLGCLRIANIIHIEAERLGQVIEPV